MSKWVHLLIFVFLSSGAFASQKLVLTGGGEFNPPAVSRFVDWASGKKAHILVVCWGTETPDVSYGYFVDALKALGPDAPASYEQAEIPGLRKSKTGDSFLVQLARSTGVFFTGGDQTMIMQRVQTDPAFLPAIQKSFEAGVVFGGSSAGTAIMPETMLTGNGDFTVIDPEQVETVAGLGLVKGFLVDQHFIIRQRQNRIFSLLMRGKEHFAIGIDQENAISIEDNHLIKVLGPGIAMTFDNRARVKNFDVKILNPGDTVDLARR